MSCFNGCGVLTGVVRPDRELSEEEWEDGLCSDCYNKLVRKIPRPEPPVTGSWNTLYCELKPVVSMQIKNADGSHWYWHGGQGGGG